MCWKFLKGIRVKIFLKVHVLKISLRYACSFFNMCEISHVLLFMNVRVGFHGQVQQAFISEFQQPSSQAFEGYFQWISKAGESNIHSFCSKDPHCWIPKCKIRLVVKPTPSGLNVVCPSILSLNGPPPNLKPLYSHSNRPLCTIVPWNYLSHGPCIFYHFTYLRI